MNVAPTISGFYVTKNANSIEAISNNPKLVFNKLYLYPASAINGGTRKLIPNTGTVHIGQRSDGEMDITPDDIVNTDLPLVIQLPTGRNALLKEVLIQADNAGDGVYFKGWPA